MLEKKYFKGAWSMILFFFLDLNNFDYDCLYRHRCCVEQQNPVGD